MTSHAPFGHPLMAFANACLGSDLGPANRPVGRSADEKCVHTTDETGRSTGLVWNRCAFVRPVLGDTHTQRHNDTTAMASKSEVNAL